MSREVVTGRGEAHDALKPVTGVEADAARSHERSSSSLSSRGSRHVCSHSLCGLRAHRVEIKRKGFWFLYSKFHCPMDSESQGFDFSGGSSVSLRSVSSTFWLPTGGFDAAPCATDVPGPPRLPPAPLPSSLPGTLISPSCWPGKLLLTPRGPAPMSPAPSAPLLHAPHTPLQTVSRGQGWDPPCWCGFTWIQTLTH